MSIKTLLVQFVAKKQQNKCSALYFRKSNGGIFKLSGTVVAKLLSCAQTADTIPEGGGVLLGRYIIQSPNIIVDRITVPSGYDIRSRFRFFRGFLYHQKIIDIVWKRSKCRFNYIGEWHTHPEPNPYPSTIDLRDWKRRLENDTVDNDSTFFIIVGTNKINVWEGKKSDRKILKLKTWQLKR